MGSSNTQHTGTVIVLIWWGKTVRKEWPTGGLPQAKIGVSVVLHIVRKSRAEPSPKLISGTPVYVQNKLEQVFQGAENSSTNTPRLSQIGRINEVLTDCESLVVYVSAFWKVAMGACIISLIGEYKSGRKAEGLVVWVSTSGVHLLGL